MTNFKVGDWVKKTGSSHWETPEPVQIIDFGSKHGEELADFSDGTWGYLRELVKVPAPVAGAPVAPPAVLNGKVMGPAAADAIATCDRCGRKFQAKFIVCVCRG